MIHIQRCDNTIEITGHAGYGKKGKDIVCSAVSILTYTLLTNLIDIQGVKVQNAVIKNGYAYLKWRPPDMESGKTACDTVVNALCTGYKIMQQNYSNYVQYTYK